MIFFFNTWREKRTLTSLLLLTVFLVLVSCCGTVVVSAVSAAEGDTTTAGIEPNVGHKGLPACDRVLQSSGYIDIPGVQGTTKHFFYWLFAPRHAPRNANTKSPVVLWLTGGPGCSFGIALGQENGPCLTNEETEQLEYNPYGWNDESYLLFIDQPIGTGYSYSEDSRNIESNEAQVSEDMYHVLQRFISTFTQPSITGSKGSDFYITGESYAGHYIPAIAHRIVQGNQRGDGPVINLRGVAIGNGMTNPLTQYQYYATYAYYYCLQALGEPCISKSAYDAMQALLPRCTGLLERCMNTTQPKEKQTACDTAGEVCTEGMLAPYIETGRNTYDIRRPCTPPGLCYPMDFAATFFNRPAVKASLGVNPGVQWQTCSQQVISLFVVDHFQNFDYMIPVLLEAGVRVLIYAGDMDFICNFMGNLAWVKSLRWSGQEAFQRAPDNEFRVGNRWAGTERQAGLLSFVRIYAAGHMVPMDQPEVSLYMLNHFLHGQSMLEGES